jgi:hypothetical protein
LTVHCERLFKNKEDAIEAAKKMLANILAGFREEGNILYRNAGQFLSTEYKVEEVEMFDAIGVVANTKFSNKIVERDGAVYINVLEVEEEYKPEFVKVEVKP